VKVNANTFYYIWSIYGDTPEAEVRASGTNETLVVAAATVENFNTIQANTEVAEDTEDAEEETVGKGASLKNEYSNVDQLSDDELSENLLASSDESEDDDKVNMHCHFKNFTLHNQWDGEVVDESQGL
jgi:hypothetical protein